MNDSSFGGIIGKLHSLNLTKLCCGRTRSRRFKQMLDGYRPTAIAQCTTFGGVDRILACLPLSNVDLQVSSLQDISSERYPMAGGNLSHLVLLDSWLE